MLRVLFFVVMSLELIQSLTTNNTTVLTPTTTTTTATVLSQITNKPKKCCSNNDYIYNNTCSSRFETTTGNDNGNDNDNDNKRTLKKDFSDKFGNNNYFGGGDSYDVTTATHRDGMPTCGNDSFVIALTSDLFKVDESTGEIFWFEGGHILKNACVEFVSDNENDVSYLTCLEDYMEDELGAEVNKVGMIISVPFLIVTLLVYLILPDRSIPSKILMCFVSALIVAYIILITLQESLFLSNLGCTAIGLSCYYFFMCSFFWMNVSCIDIYWAFRRMRGFGNNRNLKRFLIYIGYACGSPLVMLAIIIGVMQYPTRNVWFYPKFADGQCWFEPNHTVFIYFYGPISCLLLLNIVLFVLTAVKIRRVKKDTSMLKRADSRKHNADEKERFNIYVKLLFAMGINWSTEIISWSIERYICETCTYLWIVTDICNALYGVLIFFIFVFKKKTWIQLKKQYYQLRKRNDSGGNNTRDETTHLSNTETTFTSLSNNKNSICH